jgi:uncharacterized protein (DUF1015 family)
MIAILIQTKEPFSSWTTKDGREHALWKIRASEADLGKRFEEIEDLYILDGHHRLEAAHQNYLLKDKPQDRNLWIQALIYSSEYVMVHSQHRVIQDIPANLDIASELVKLEHIEVTELDIEGSPAFCINAELANYEVILKEAEKVYGINFKTGSRNVIQKISTYRLQDEILSELLDEALLKRLKYVPGIVNQQELLKHEAIFFVRQPEIDILFELADSEVMMPPKSTWIEPKPCSHMVIRLTH